ncbi:ABC transporter ATP-binding protein [Crocinitomicaceae bacterium CZZ-1]|uniref:ABC transporter ATP-binding protein n=1 Tax=Taishania pollutisoli TaxID=2766479 RepID=A0A8J6U1W0_9FLAO|nr:ABC transporter ATP-binding protein [Taishania pollutisoli]MBC9811635.1 ABC transporter ATP-binding protein [Taishania pollutisoli]NGF75528.1 ABC transporter ATP-binding protein [Fluviicola sp. SGL-29]
MLAAKNIHKKYDHLEILKGISLEVTDSEIVSIVGSSGAGKTTLLQILGTLDKPDQGILEINGINPFQLSSKKIAAFRNQHIGFIFQFHQLLPEFTALENVCIPAMMNGKSMVDAKKLATPLLDRLGLSHRGEHKPNELSGGEQQRVAVARALVNKPSIIFADEPSGNLDTENSTMLHNLFFELREEFKQTFVIVTHNEDLAKMADRMITMKDGLVIG